jgi:hypothetical protein
MRRNRRFSEKMLIVSVLAIVMSVSMIFSVWGYSGGRWDRAKTGCECHSLTADPTVSVDITGLPAEYMPGQSYPVTVTVSGGSITAKGGFNLEVSSGTLSPNDSNTQVNLPENQTTHTNSNQRSWVVNWLAPTSGTGDVTFWVAGNAVNGNGNTGGDGWNLNSYVVPESIVTDAQPPEISNVMINGALSQTYPLSSIPTLTLTATIDDSNNGNSDIGGANFTQGVQNWGTSQPMSLQNPPTSPNEIFEATITPPTIARSYGYYVYGWDDVPNYNFSNVQEYASLTITDDLAPIIFNVTLNGAPTLNLLRGEVVVLSAEVDDTSFGGSNIGGANYTVGEKNFASSVQMNSQDSTFDEASEIVEISIDATDWEPGTYDFYVYGYDDASPANNQNVTSLAFATLIIRSPPVNVIVSQGKEDGTLEIGWDADITATFSKYNIYRSLTQGGPYTLVGTVNKTETSFFDNDLDEGETYYYVLTGVGSRGSETDFSEEASATVGEDAEPEDDEEFPVIMPIIALVILIIIIILLFIMRKKYKGES